MEPKLFENRSGDEFVDKYCNESANISDMSSVSTTTYLLCIFVGSLSVLIMCGNLLLIISIIYFKQLHTPTNFLILSLAVADLLVGLLVMPFSTILAVSSCWHLGDLLCNIRTILDIYLCTASILNLCCISVDRYYAVCQPLIYTMKINIRVTVFMILVNWSFPALIGLVITNLGVNQGQSNKKCVLFHNKNLAIVAIVLGFYTPAVIMFSIYIKILTVAQRQARSIQNTKSGATVSKMERKATKTLAIVIGVFLICWTPYFLSMSFNPLTNYTIPVPVIAVFKWLGWSNSMLNPFVYAFFYSWFRSAIKMILSGKLFQGDYTNAKLF